MKYKIQEECRCSHRVAYIICEGSKEGFSFGFEYGYALLACPYHYDQWRAERVD